MAATTASQVCPIVGTKNTILPPSHVRRIPFTFLPLSTCSTLLLQLAFYSILSSNTKLTFQKPDFDASKPGLVCPITNATTDHHHILQKHPGLGKDVDLNAQKCPVLKEEVSTAEAKKMDEGICPVVGIVSVSSNIISEFFFPCGRSS
jgi:hypothetical protein